MSIEPKTAFQIFHEANGGHCILLSEDVQLPWKRKEPDWLYRGAYRVYPSGGYRSAERNVDMCHLVDPPSDERVRLTIVCAYWSERISEAKEKFETMHAAVQGKGRRGLDQDAGIWIPNLTEDESIAMLSKMQSEGRKLKIELANARAKLKQFEPVEVPPPPPDSYGSGIEGRQRRISDAVKRIRF